MSSTAINSSFNNLHPVAVKQSSFTFIDLFCGIGGFRFAFEKVDGKCVFSNDIDKYACLMYEANHGDKPHGDMNQMRVEDVPAHDILCAGFPCQPFSIAGVTKKISLGRAHGFDDEKQGNLFFKIADLLEYHKPAAFLLENVKNLKSHDKGRTFQTIFDILTQRLGYHVQTKVIDARYLVPQHRERIFIVGFKENRNFTFPNFPSEGPKLGSILQKDVPEKYTLTDGMWKFLQEYAAKHRAAGHGFGYGLVTRESVTRTLSARYYKDGSEILVAQEGKNPRRLTPRECARLMGYPDTLKIPLSDTQAYKRFGNGIVLPVVERVAANMIEALLTHTI